MQLATRPLKTLFGRLLALPILFEEWGWEPLQRKQDLVAGRYELPAPTIGSKVAIKVVDMLGEEHVVVVAMGWQTLFNQ